MKITKKSLYTNKKHTMDIDVTEEQYQCWLEGGDIDECMPNLSYEERQFLLTGASPDELDDVYNDDDDEGAGSRSRHEQAIYYD